MFSTANADEISLAFSGRRNSFDNDTNSLNSDLHANESHDVSTRELRSSNRSKQDLVDKSAKRRKVDNQQLFPSGSGSIDSRESSCEENECTLDTECCVQLTPQCVSLAADIHYKSNYFHLTCTEHVCYYCYEEMARVGRTFYDRYNDWKNIWVQESRCTPSLRLFALDSLLPYWISCKECGKFRKVSADENDWTDKTISHFNCKQLDELSSFNNPCSVEENEKVKAAKDMSWIQTASAPTFLHNSPALHYLKGEYYCDEIGMSPTRSKFARIPNPKAASFMIPFNIPNGGSVAFCVRPDGMEYDELKAFPEYLVESVPYLALRNLIVALWNLNPFIYLTYDKCLDHLICRGLSRVWYAMQLKRVYNYLCLKNIINYGILDFPGQKLLRKVSKSELKVIVIGGGMSGLTTARQLRLNGAKVVVLEASDRCGGRMLDDFSLGVAVGCGAQLITGITNNPLILMCEQINVGYRPLSDECPLMDAVTGKIVSPLADRLVDEHFNCVLDATGEWRRLTRNVDVSLLSQIKKFHNTLTNALEFKWNDEHERIMQWQIGNVEFSCGAHLSDVSARNWDQNEAVGQFAGDHALLYAGSKRIIDGLAATADVRFHHHVKKIDYGTNNRDVIVSCSNGKKFTAHKVVLCLPLAVYQKKTIHFNPALPKNKIDAFNQLGAGLIEKVAVRFRRCFWSSLMKKDGKLDYFGHVPKDEKNRGLFNMFYDFSVRVDGDEKYVLMSYVCGESVNVVNNKSDEEVVDLFVEVLRDMFPNEEIPEHDGYVVTHWGRNPNIGMSYSYVRVGANGDHYDKIAEPVKDRLYFAGECTNRFFPQTMTGAYVSGLREASRVAESWLFDGD